MNDHLRDRILRKLENLSDERAYQVLDYVEFMESRYAERQNPPANVFSRFAETVEDRLRQGRVSASTIAEAMGLMNRAVGVLNGVAAAGKSVANDIVGAATRPAPAAPPAAPPTPAPGPPAASAATGAAPSAATPSGAAPPSAVPQSPPLAPTAPPASPTPGAQST